MERREGVMGGGCGARLALVMRESLRVVMEMKFTGSGGGDGDGCDETCSCQ